VSPYIVIMSKKLIRLGPILLQDWIIQASMFKERILVYMYNELTGVFHIQYVINEIEANIFIVYVIEKKGQI